jgi:hypothetical protein
LWHLRTFERNNLPHENPHIQRYLYRAEIQGLLCSGALQGKKHTYALLDERVPPLPPVPRDEAVVRLLQLYLHSHAPTTLADFSWWSGLTLTESKPAACHGTRHIPPCHRSRRQGRGAMEEREEWMRKRVLVRHRTDCYSFRLQLNLLLKHSVFSVIRLAFCRLICTFVLQINTLAR